MPIKTLGVACLLVATFLESLAQMALKVGSAGGPKIFSAPFDRWARAYRVTSSAFFWVLLGVVFYIVQILLYTLVLHWLDVSEAFPMGSICFALVALLSKLFLGETVNRRRWLGVCCILAGTVFLAF